MASDDDWILVYRRRALLVVLAAAFVVGLSFERSAFPRSLAALGFGSALACWCVLDARVHGKAFLHSFGWQLMWTWPIGAAVYLWWIRRWRGLGTYFAFAGACLALGLIGRGCAEALR